MAEQRIQKVLSDQGVCSRRAAEKLIDEGRVKVNGHPGKLPFPHKTKRPRPYSSCHVAKTKAGVFFNARG